MNAERQDVREAVLVTWVSVNHKAAPLLTAIQDTRSPLRSRVARIYLCWRDAPGADGEREREALQETVNGLRSELRPICPEIVKVAWKTKAAPTDHAALRPFAEEVLGRARGENPECLIAIHLSPGTPAMHAVWLVLGTTGFLPGPVELIQTADDRARAAGQPPVQRVRLDLDTWLRRYRAARPRKTSSDDDGQMWDPVKVKSPALREVFEKLEQWAPLRVPVLLVGERGTGKTTLANLIRAKSPYQKEHAAGWPTVVCGQFRANQELARSELFGHVKGAFTGAHADRQGLLEQADGDTLFLDEIADIDRGTQRLLMAAIEGRGFQRLGDTKVRQSRFRLICATNRPLAQLPEALDPDFLDRVAVFVLNVPPLRQCREDLPEAWRHIVTSAMRTAEVQPDGWERFLNTRSLLDSIADHPLPGNFRDLQRAAFHLLASLSAGKSESAVVEGAVAALGAGQAFDKGPPTGEDLIAQLPLDGDGGLRARVEAYEAAWLRAAMKRASNNQSQAANLLGMARRTFADRWKAVCG